MNRDTKNFIKELFENERSLQLTATFHAVLDDEAMQNVELFEILGLDKGRINETGQKIIDILEHDKDMPRELYTTLKWKVLALITVQDTFRGVIHGSGQVDSLFYKSYFYFESLHILREYFYCGFNNFQISAQHLLRTLLEFSIKQNYYDHVCMTQNSFAPLEKYLEDGIAPDPAKMLNVFLPKDKLATPLKKQVQMILKGLAKSSSHAYMPAHSVRGNGKLQHEYSLDSLHFWATLLPVLDGILWLYYFQLPQLFNPKDVPRKFGFSPPVGCFISPEQHVAVKKSLKPKDYKMFKQFADSSDEVSSLNDFYDSQPDMTNEQIMASWDEEGVDPPASVEAGYFRAVVQLRAMQEVMANNCAVEAAKKFSERKDTDQLFSDISQYDWWLKNYKHVR